MVPPMWEGGKIRVKVPICMFKSSVIWSSAQPTVKWFIVEDQINGTRVCKWAQRGLRVVLLLVGIRKNSAEFSVGFRKYFLTS